MNEQCPVCDRTDTTYVLRSTETLDEWGCRCGHEWRIEVAAPVRVGRSA